MRPLLLDAYCGGGGASAGYVAAGWRVIGVDHTPQPRYPYEFVRGDAIEMIAAVGSHVDAIHASPPCQRYSRITPVRHRETHADLIAATRQALAATGRPWVMENVPDARAHLHSPLMLCGSMFGLAVRRHRLFECSPPLALLLPTCDHSGVPVLVTGTPRRRGCPRVDPSAATKRAALRTPWMRIVDMDQAIPPAYTECVGRALLRERT